MTRLDGAQVMGSGEGERQLGFPSNRVHRRDGHGKRGPFVRRGWFLGGAIFQLQPSPDLKVGLMTGNFHVPLKYDDNWAGRYYVQEATLVGISFVPAIAYKVTKKLSVGGSVTAMDGIYRNQVAINNAIPIRRWSTQAG